ncbi:MAG: FecR domain-containing protein [Bacteroidota bacterium]
MEDAKYVELIGRYLSGNLDVEAYQVLMAWVEADPTNKAFFEEMEQLWRISATNAAPFTTNTEAAWQKVEQRIEGAAAKPREAKVLSLPIVRTLVRVAAMVILSLGVYWWYSQSGVEPAPSAMLVQTVGKETKVVNLPDGSVVTLNENTELEFVDRAEERQVRLTGEAYFEVAKDADRPFIIGAGATETKVLGTAFNLRAYPNETTTEIAVTEGLVSFEAIGKEAATQLRVGDAGIFDKQAEQLVTQKIDIANANAWKTKRLSFEDMEMRAVIPILERYFNAQITYSNEDILNCQYRGIFENTDLKTILKAIEFSMNFKIDQRADTIFIDGKGCKRKDSTD